MLDVGLSVVDVVADEFEKQLLVNAVEIVDR